MPRPIVRHSCIALRQFTTCGYHSVHNIQLGGQKTCILTLAPTAVSAVIQGVKDQPQQLIASLTKEIAKRAAAVIVAAILVKGLAHTDPVRCGILRATALLCLPGGSATLRGQAFGDPVEQADISPLHVPKILPLVHRGLIV